MLHNLITRQLDMGDTLMSQVGGAAAAGIGGLTGAIMGIPGQAIGNALQLGQQRNLSDLQEQENEKFANFSMGLQKQMWDYTNYENQVKHLQAAGLNPALLYGSHGGGGTTTGTVSAPAGMGIAAPGQGIAAQEANLQAQETAADIKVKEAQAKALDAQATKTSGVDTQSTQAAIDNTKQLTKNAEVQNSILQWQAGMASADATVATQTIDTRIAQITTSYEKLVQEVRSATTAADLSEATKQQVIQQAKNATILQALDMVLTKAKTTGQLTDIEATKTAIQMSIQKNMREWDQQTNLNQHELEERLQGSLKTDVPNIGEELLQSITHFIIPIALTPTPKAPGQVLKQITDKRNQSPAGGHY